jgi:hypothetical protein
MSDTSFASAQMSDPRFNPNDKANWLKRLAGETVIDAPDHVDYGFYRTRSRDGMTWLPVAFWYVEERGLDPSGAAVVRWVLRGRLGLTALDELRAREIAPYASANPITHELYTKIIDALKAGATLPWPDLNPAVSRVMSNLPPSENSLEALREAIDDLRREAERLIKTGAAKTEAEADQAGDVANALAGLEKRADAARVVEKAPHLQACRDVDDKWRGVISAAGIYERLKNIVCEPWLDAEKARKAKAEADARAKAEDALRVAREAEDEARRKAQEAERVATEAAQGDVDAEALAEQQAEAANEAAEAAAALAREAAQATQVANQIATQTVTAGSRGRGVHLRTVKIVTITDRDAVLAFFKDREEITALLQSMAEKAVKAGITVPGITVTNDTKAA